MGGSSSGSSSSSSSRSRTRNHLAFIYGNINTYGGNDNVYGAAFYAKVRKSSGNLGVYGAFGGLDVTQTGSGNVTVGAAVGVSKIKHYGSSGNVTFKGVAGYNNIYRSGYSGDVRFYGAGIANVINHRTSHGWTRYYGAGGYNRIDRSNARSGGVKFYGAGAYNKISLSGSRGDVNFYGAGIANVITHRASDGWVRYHGAGGYNRIDRSYAQSGGVKFYGAGAYNKISLSGSRGDVNFYGAGIANVVTHQANDGWVRYYGAGGYNRINRSNAQSGGIEFYGAGLANIVTLSGYDGDLTFVGAGAGNIVTHSASYGDLKFTGAGLANVVTRIGDGNVDAYMGGGANAVTHRGDGRYNLTALGAANVSTKIGDGDCNLVLAGIGNVHTQIGDGDLSGLFLAAGNVITKVGDGDAAVLMAAVGNVYTQTGTGNATVWSIGQANITTRVGNGDLYFMQLGVQLTPVPLTANVITQVGNGRTMGLMTSFSLLGGANVLTKVGDGDLAVAMVSLNATSPAVLLNVGLPTSANIITQIGNGRSMALMVGGGNVFTKVGAGATNDNQLTWSEAQARGLLGAQGNSTIARQVNRTMRDGVKGLGGLINNRKFDTILAALGNGNIMTEVNTKSLLNEFENTDQISDTIGTRQTNSLMVGIGGLGNAMVKVGDGDLIAIAIANPLAAPSYLLPMPTLPLQLASAALTASGNVMVHVGHGNTNLGAIGNTNVAIKVGDGGMKAFMLGDNNVIVRIGDAANTQQAVNTDTNSFMQGVQGVYGDRNVVINVGKSNDVIVAIDPNVIFTLAVNLTTFGLRYASEMAGWATEIAGLGGLKVPGTDKLPADKTLTWVDNLATISSVSGNLIYGGEGSDIIVVAGANNVVFGDSWTDVLDLDAHMLYDGKNENSLIKSIPIIGDIFGSRFIGTYDFISKPVANLIEKVPVVGGILGKLAGEIGIPSILKAMGIPDAEIMLTPNTDHTAIGEMFGVIGNPDGTLSTIDPSVVAEHNLQALGGMEYVQFYTPTVWTSVFGTLVNTIKLISGDSLTVGGPGYTGVTGAEFLGGWNTGEPQFISALGIPELISSIINKDEDGRNVFQQFFDKETNIGWGAMWKDPEAFWEGVHFLEGNGDLVAALGSANAIMTGDGGDFVAALGRTNIIATGAGRDLVFAGGIDNRIATGEGNDFAVALGERNLLLGGEGSDLLVAMGRYNRLRGNDGDDFLIALGEKNALFGHSGNDILIGAGLNNTIFCGSGDDLVIGVGLYNTYFAGSGNDTIINFGFASQNFYGEGDDVAIALGAYETLFGEDGDDVLTADERAVDNYLAGGEGNDTINLGGVGTRVSGGNGSDRFVVTADVREQNLIEDHTSSDQVLVSNDIAIEDIWLTQDGDDLLIEIDRWDQSSGEAAPESSVGEVTISNWFAENGGSDTGILFEFDEEEDQATTISEADINALVQAMASFERADASGNFRDNMSDSQKDQLATLWASSGNSVTPSLAA